MNCKFCGSTNPDGAKFCRSCGKKLEESKGCGNYFLLLLLLCGIIGGVIYFINTQNSRYAPNINDVDSTEVDSIVDTVEVDSIEVQSNASYLSISDNNITLMSGGESEVITVESDGDWQVGTGTESWLSLSRDGNQLTITAEENKGYERSDYFTIVADDIEKRVDVKQFANTNPYAEFTKIWVDYNEYNDYGTKGMMIHVAFKAHNMLGKDGRVSVYFYMKDGTPLVDTNGSYRTTDGNVSTGKDFSPRYENSDYADFKLFMPYSELHLDASAELYFKASIWYNNEEISDDSEKIYMTFTKG